MGDILFLADAVPSPQGRSDRVRGYHFLARLARQRRVHLLAFADDRDDVRRKDALARLCATRSILWRSAPGLPQRLAADLGGTPSSMISPEDGQMRAAIRKALAARRVDTIFAQSLRMALLVPERLPQRLVVDLMEPPSVRADAFARTAGIGARLGWRRLARRLTAQEDIAAARSDLLLLASSDRPERFGDKARIVGNRVDTHHFAPEAVTRRLETPGILIGVIGQQHDAADRASAAWFMEAVLPHVRAVHGDARIVLLPGAGITGLADLEQRYPGLKIARGDQRPWLAASTLLVAPWLHAGGSSLPILEAMAMGRPVIASAAAASTLDHGGALHLGLDVSEMIDKVLQFASPGFPAAEIGSLARAHVHQHHLWDANAAADTPLWRDAWL